MKAAVYYRTGAPSVFSYEDVPDPALADDGVLVQVEVISVEGGDTLHRAGGELAAVPHVVGYQCAGTAVAVGPAVRRVAVGDRVVTVGLDGSHAELRSVPEAFCWRIPEPLSTEAAAVVPVAFGTAHDCLFEFGHLQDGETVLVQAGASGVGIAAIQMAKQAGARVLASASRDDKLGRLAELGMDEGINYATNPLVAEVRRLTEGRGVDLVVESVGGDGLGDALQCLAYRGRCVSLGDAGRSGSTLIDMALVRPNNLTLTGYFLGAELFLNPRAHQMIEALLAQVADGRLQVVVDRRFELRQAAEAHAYIEGRQAFGRVVLVP